MALSISTDKTKWRYDSTGLVGFVPVDIADTGIVQFGEWDYKRGVTTDFEHRFRNRSYIDLPITLRDAVEVPTWVLTSGVTGSGAGPILNGNIPGGGAGVNGGYYNTAIDGDLCSVQARVESGGGISLQDGSLTPTHDYTNAQVAHSMRCLGDGSGEIRELGVVVPVGGNFQWTLEGTDTILIQLKAGVVKYFLVKEDDTMILLRTTRSKLTEDPKFEINLEDEANSLSEIYFTQTTEASTEIEIVGVLENFQDWNNEYFISSTADAIVMANNEPQFTYPNPKTRIRALNANLAMRDKTFRLYAEDFFNWHGTEKEFLFVDKAKTDIDDVATEWWARFASPFGDRSRNSCLSAHSAQIVESYRRDYIPKS